MKRKYKLGDKIVGVEEMDGNQYIVGLRGTIICLDTQHENLDSDCLIEFDSEFQDGHSGGDRGKDHHCWYVHFRCIKLLKQKFQLADIVQILSGEHKFKVGTVLDYTDSEGKWLIKVGKENLRYRQRYLVLQGRKQLI